MDHDAFRKASPDIVKNMKLMMRASMAMQRSILELLKKEGLLAPTSTPAQHRSVLYGLMHAVVGYQIQMAVDDEVVEVAPGIPASASSLVAALRFAEPVLSTFLDAYADDPDVAAVLAEIASTNASTKALYPSSTNVH